MNKKFEINNSGEKKEINLSPEMPKEAIDFRNKLDELVFGQDEAKDEIVKALLNSIYPFSDEGTIGSFIFTGPSGVGKTELAQAAAQIALGDRNAFRKIDCNQFNDNISSQRLIGSSYVGDSHEAILNEADLFAPAEQALQTGNMHDLMRMVGTKKFSIILFDEIEKAHPSVFDTIMTLLDKGKVELNSGGSREKSYPKVTDLRNTLVIFTSNEGSIKEEGNNIGFISTDKEDKAQNYIHHLKNQFRPEFLNRITKIIPFYSLDKEAYKFKIDQISSNVSNELERTFNVSLEIEENLKNYILDKQESESFQGEMRNIERFFDFYISQQIKNLIAGGKLDELNIGAEGGSIFCYLDEDTQEIKFKIEYEESTLPEEHTPDMSFVQSDKGLFPTEHTAYLHNGSFILTLNELIIPNLKLLKTLYEEREKYGGKNFGKGINDVKNVLMSLGFQEDDLSYIKKEAISTLVEEYNSLFDTYSGLQLVSEEEKQQFGKYYKPVKKYIERFLKERGEMYNNENGVIELYMDMEEKLQYLLNQKELTYKQYEVVIRIIHHLFIDKYKLN